MRLSITQILTEHGHDDVLPRLGTLSETEQGQLTTDVTIMLTYMRPSMVAQAIAKRVRSGAVMFGRTPEELERLNTTYPTHPVGPEYMEPIGLAAFGDGACIKCDRAAVPGYQYCVDCAYTRGE
jgi:hypothetical protein